MEQWKDVKGYEGLYAVSSYGRVKSYDKPGAWKERILSANLYKKSGYLYVNLYKIGTKAKKAKIHRLVAGAFRENPDSLPEVNHKDGNKKNNHVDNLEWCSRGDNALHLCYELGISVRKAVPIRIEYNGGEVREFRSVREAAKLMGVHCERISTVLNKKCQKDYGYTVTRI